MQLIEAHKAVTNNIARLENSIVPIINETAVLCANINNKVWSNTH